MKQIFWPSLFLLAMLFSPWLASAASYPVGEGIRLWFEDPPPPWTVSEYPTDFLIAERAGHLHEPQLAAARKAGINDPREAARQMLSINELFLSNPATGAHIEVDFSPLKPGDEPPTMEVLKSSAEFAGQGLANEEGIGEVHSRVRPFPVSGAQDSFRLDADYVMHGAALHFAGVIGYAAGHWFFLYYTGPQENVADLRILEAWLTSCRIEIP